MRSRVRVPLPNTSFLFALFCCKIVSMFEKVENKRINVFKCLLFHNKAKK